MKKSDLERILKGDIAHIDEVDQYEKSDPNLEIIIFPIDIKKILLSYLNNEISEIDLNKWAEFLCFRGGEYVCDNWKNDEIADFYEDMWYVVQKLSTPEIDGEINHETARTYLKELDKYFKSNDSTYS